MKAIIGLCIEHLVKLAPETKTNDPKDTHFVPNRQSVSYTHLLCIAWSRISLLENKPNEMEALFIDELSKVNEIECAVGHIYQNDEYTNSFRPP